MPPTPTTKTPGIRKRKASRRSATAARSSATVAAATTAVPTAETSQFVCPECGRAFTRAPALGSHRSRVHGVRGTSATSKSAAAKTTRTRRARQTSRRAATATAQTNGTQATRTRPTTAGVDRDALLATLFPNGVPPRESVIRELAAWLDQAEKLATQR